ncbi:MAG: hypothetical protein E7211_20615 [Clostridium lundense]|nr:hypothetical protein [Clostridium lundense]
MRYYLIIKDDVISGTCVTDVERTDINYVEVTYEEFYIAGRYKKYNPSTKEFAEPYEETGIVKFKADKVLETKKLLATWLEQHPLESTVHNEEGELYTVTEEKQSLLTQNLMLAQLTQSQITTWNCQGGICEEWATTKLVQLALEIEAYVRPRIKKQQAYEVQINSCSTVEEVAAIEIEYDTI